MKIRSAVFDDAGQITEIYNHFIRETVVTFELVPIDASTVWQRIQKVQMQHTWIVLEVDGSIKGYAYSSAWKERAAYRDSNEISIYLHPTETGKGYGKLLYQDLIDRAKKLGVHVLIGGISLPNDASIKLHEAFGFKKVAQFEEVGFTFNRWIDVGYWQLILKAE